MPLSTTQLPSLRVPSLRFSNWFQTKFRPILRKQEVYKKHDYTVQITPAAVCLIYTLMISSPSNKSIAVYLWMCSFVWPKAAHLHQTLQWHQCLLVITATCPVHWSINATWVYLLFHWDTDKLRLYFKLSKLFFCNRTTKTETKKVQMAFLTQTVTWVLDTSPVF